MAHHRVIDLKLMSAIFKLCVEPAGIMKRILLLCMYFVG